MKPPKTITSLTNPQIKAVVRLRNRAERDQTGLTLIDGAREIGRAVAAGVTLEELYISKSFHDDHANNALLNQLLSKTKDLVNVSDDVFAKIAFGERQEGLVAVCRAPRPTLADVKLSSPALVVVMEGVQKPGNLGAVLRTCDAVGVDTLMVCDGGTDIYNPNVIRASLGTVFSIPVVSQSSQDAIRFLKTKGVRICAASLQAKKDYADMSGRAPLAIVLGSEDKGLSPLWQESADDLLCIPMKGKTDSLNVSVAAAVMLYEVLRQRSRQKG